VGTASSETRVLQGGRKEGKTPWGNLLADNRWVFLSMNQTDAMLGEGTPTHRQPAGTWQGNKKRGGDRGHQDEGDGRSLI